MPNDKFIFESIQDKESIIKYLNAIKDGFTNGTITLADKEKKIDLIPNDEIKLKIKSYKKKNQVKMQFKLDWKFKRDTESNNQLIINSNK